MTKHQIKLMALTLGLASELAANAGTLVSYANGDVLVCFRKSGAANDLVVNAGPIATFTNAAVNQRLAISQFTTNQLYNIGLNSVIFSAFTRLDDSISPASAQWTLFMSRGRSSLTTQTTAWPQRPQAAQALVGGDMDVILAGAATLRNYNGLNTDTAVLEPDDASNSNPNYTSGQSYVGTMGANLDFNGDFVGSPEKTAPNNFVTGSTVVRSDFYWIPPQGAGSVKFLGYFELNTNGVLSYVAYPVGTPTTPVITGMARTNTVSYISFTSGSFGTYTLRGTNSSAGFATAKTNWPAITSTTVSSAGTKTLTDTAPDANKFYVITAQ